MSEQSVIETTVEPITKERIIYDLMRGGIDSRDNVLLHSSLSSLGWVIGKSMTVVDAFLEVLVDGTLIMPAQTGDNSDPSKWVNPPVPESWWPIIREHTPSFHPEHFDTRGMGKVVECFRHYKGVLRSPHPTSSFLAKGRQAKYIVKNHPLTPTFGMASPLGRLYDLNAKVLLLGVGFGNATALHLAEAISGVLSKEQNGTKFNEKWVDYEDFAYDSDRFEEIGELLLQEEIAYTFEVGQAKAICFRVRDAVDFASNWWKEHPPVQPLETTKEDA